MIDIKEKHNCCGCQSCAQACPKNCIAMNPDEEGFLYPVVDKEKCIHCGLCTRVCPILHSPQGTSGTPTAYAAYNRDEDVRRKSSSGGIFTLLAEQVLAQNGTVYGAAMVHSHIQHIRVEYACDLEQLRGSKYVQSDIGRTFLQAKQDLEAGKQVLFTGTPCQIEGLKAFLHKDYDNLISMDMICHGVPSPMVWEEYVKQREKKARSKIEKVSFRHKKHGWESFSMRIIFSNNAIYHQRLRYDSFLRAFLKNLCLRPSCYQCSFKKFSRVSDITVADFWGIGAMLPDMNDDKGVSLVFLHSQKGEALFKSIEKQMVLRLVDAESAAKFNSAMTKSVSRPDSRDAFMARIRTEPIDSLIGQFTPNPFNLKVEMKFQLKRMLKKLGLLEQVKIFKTVLKHR